MVHRLLYCETYEVELYHAQFVEASERAKIDIDEIGSEVVTRIEKEFERRIYRKASGQETFDHALIFYQILKLCIDENSEKKIVVSIDQPRECIYQNLAVLIKIGLLSKESNRYTNTPKGRKLYRQLSVL